jgi:hypothetical protein
VQEAEQQLIAIQAQLRELEPQIDQLYAQLKAIFDDLEARLADAAFPTLEALNLQISTLQKKMTALEPVNMLAIAEFEQVSTRQQELATKLETLETEKEALANKVHSYEELKRQYFMKAFDSVNKQFKEIYAELSDGHGQLILTNPTDPLAGGLSIEASPRGKKTQRIEAMRVAAQATVGVFGVDGQGGGSGVCFAAGGDDLGSVRQYGHDGCGLDQDGDLLDQGVHRDSGRPPSPHRPRPPAQREDRGSPAHHPAAVHRDRCVPRSARSAGAGHRQAHPQSVGVPCPRGWHHHGHRR